MVCVICGWWRDPKHRILCWTCTGALRRAGEVRLDSGLLVRSLFVHQDPIRSAVHAFKYHGVDRIGRVLAPRLAGLLPADASALVPVPRSFARRVRFGVDPGRVLASYVARYAGLPVADVLRAPLYRRSQLRERRSEGIGFRTVGLAPDRAVLVDDVLTTGATLNAASAACRGRISRAVTLTRSQVTVSAERRSYQSGPRKAPEGLARRAPKRYVRSGSRLVHTASATGVAGLRNSLDHSSGPPKVIHVETNAR